MARKGSRPSYKLRHPKTAQTVTLLRQAPARITSQKWQVGPGIETPSRDFRGRGGFVCRPQGEVRSR
ncbi:MAG: hypothetical protein E5W40_02925 [Mesorhizobium sp.]|nr:MAG: hypothetical protein E5W40_02925 [Mesorhizobium sp.]